MVRIGQHHRTAGTPKHKSEGMLRPLEVTHQLDRDVGLVKKPNNKNQPRRPNKLQKQRRGMPHTHHRADLRRTVSFDIASLSDHSHRALLNAHFAVTSKYQGQYPAVIQKAVLKKRRNNRVRNSYQGFSSAPPRLEYREDPHYQHPLPASIPSHAPFNAPQDYPNHSSNEYSSSLTGVDPNIFPAAQEGNPIKPGDILPVSYTRMDQTTPIAHSQPDSLSLSDVNSKDKPLPPTPQIEAADQSAFIEQFSPSTCYRSFSSKLRENTDMLVSNIGENEVDKIDCHSTLPSYLMKPLPQHPSQTKLQYVITDFMVGQRAYLQTLRSTVANDQACDSPVDLLLSLLSVIQVSEDFLRQMEDDATPSGIAKAFLSTCGQLESRLLQWSRQVSEFINDQSVQLQAGDVHSFRQSSAPFAEQPRHSGMRRYMGFLKRKPSTQPQVKAQQPKPLLPDKFWQPSETGPGLWEMAVLPTQRTMRYAFTFKELLSSLDVSHEDYQIVEQAFHAANFIAQKMTRAQQRPLHLV